MKIIRKKEEIKPEDMVDGRVYKVTLKSKDEYYIMPIYVGNLCLKLQDYQYLVTDLGDGCAFTIDYDEFEKIEELNAKLMIE